MFYAFPARLDMGCSPHIAERLHFCMAGEVGRRIGVAMPFGISAAYA
jgi:hypothetical protein